ncbi:MAG: DUF1822 family protein, partial [Okeania sp. SIO2G5]|nr:DUF1822 family protein [Okeania sp. SIO2G5]
MSYLDVNPMSVYDPLSFSIPLPLSIHATAQRFCQPHWSSIKAKQVYLNTLAVYAVKSYLGCLGVSSYLEQGNSWDPIHQCFADSADLMVGAQGRLECRPVLSASSTCYVPPEVWSDRIGYVAVQLDDELRYGKPLGFLPQVTTSEIPLERWRSLNSLLQALETSYQPVALSSSRSISSVSFRRYPTSVVQRNSVTHLTGWLKGTIEAGWQRLEDLILPEHVFPSSPPTLQFRGVETPLSTVCGKYLDWQLPTGEQENLVLVVGVMPAQKSEMNIWVKLCPQHSSVYLPARLEVVVLDEQNVAVMQAQSRQTEMIQLKF